MFKFNRTYFILSLLLLATEIIIIAYTNDAYIRPFVGDFLWVILIYCLIKTIVKSDVNLTVVGVLLFAVVIEVLQYFHILNLLGLQGSAIACIIMGTDFAWTDILMYTLGMLMVWLTERSVKRV